MKSLLLTALLLASALARSALPCPAEPVADAAPEADVLLRLFNCDPPPDDDPALRAPLNEQVLRWLDAGAAVDSRDERGRQPLHLALARLSDDDTWRDIALLLLSRGAPALTADQTGTTPLHLASAERDGLVSGELLTLGADPLRPDNNGLHALDHASLHPDNRETFGILLAAAVANLDDDGRELLIERLIQHQRADLLDALLLAYPQQQLDPVDASRALANLLWQGARVETAERFWRAGADPQLLHSQGGGDLAWRLASLGHDAELDWLLAGGFPLNRLPASGIPPLFFASTDASRRLLARGADPNLPSRELGTLAAAFMTPPPPFDQGGAALDRARLAVLLEAGLDPNRRDGQGMTALERAVSADQLWLVQALLAAGADPLRTRSGERSLLPMALAQGRLPMVQAMIRAMPDVQDRHPLLLLDYVGSDAPDPTLVEALLVAGLSPDLSGAEGESALLRAARLQRWPLVSLLLRYGANPDLSNAQGCTLHCYSWAMPEAVRLSLPGQEPPTWQWPSLARSPAAFFALALSPMLALWLASVGVALARRRPLWPGLLWLALTLVATVAVGASLFFDCDPCLLQNSRAQSQALMVLAGVLYLLGPWRRRLGRAGNAQS